MDQENTEQTNKVKENKSSVGSLIGTIIIIAIIILGGLYFWGKRIEENKAKANLITDFTPGTEENAIATSTIPTNTVPELQ
jgi:flagellar basal body-associated protein FliL